ncbi:MAG: hypothetical protein WDZ85_01385 [Candidatus Paceibacterota bacterium]
MNRQKKLKIGIGLMVLLVITGLILPLTPVLAQSATTTGLVPCTDDCDFNQLYVLVDNIIDFIVFYLAVPIATGVIAFAGIWLVIYAGNEGKRSDAKKMIWSAVIGLVIVLSAYLIIKAIIVGLTGGEVGTQLQGIFGR